MTFIEPLASPPEALFMSTRQPVVSPDRNPVDMYHNVLSAAA